MDKLLLKNKLADIGVGKSFDHMTKGEWYRLFTAPFFHINLFHLMGNAFGIYFVGFVLEHKIGSGLFLLIYMVGNLCVSLLFSSYSSFTSGKGASPGIFALIGCFLYLFTQTPDLFNFQFGNWTTNYIFFYAVLGNFIGVQGAISHVLGFIFGMVMSFFLL
ncbi:rhomboid family intramembrane serine protease [Guptibacillus algicola]|uniref:rhomboid family intramembrane serine protease n=1 Tax=Guptibacillus algicola TaxID=225844 RepID=UPI001CD438BF|nr:rhomboid family intramembrane serine protease [Alkalihalobacillus algicola]MCA0987326.1 rhomboid family intramembrane serine protease [Alkalihalobacillus algicola]